MWHEQAMHCKPRGWHWLQLWFSRAWSCTNYTSYIVQHTTYLMHTKAKIKTSMFPIVCPKTAIHNAVFNFLFYRQKKQQCTFFFINRMLKKYMHKQYHRQGTNHFCYLFCKEVRNCLKYLIYHKNISDVFSMLRQKKSFCILFLWYLCEKKK